MSPNLEVFEWNKKTVSENPIVFMFLNKMETSIEILESLPISLKSLFIGVAFGGYAWGLNERMSRCLGGFQILRHIGGGEGGVSRI